MTKNDAVYLIGLRGSGKSTIGRLLAERLGFVFVDCDELFEARHQLSIASYFQQHGEPAFRDAESQLLRELAGGRKQVVATGGGCVIRSENRLLLQSTGTVVWLTGKLDILLRRLENDPRSASRRPPLTEKPLLAEIRRLAREREPWYREIADLTIATDGRSPEQVVAAILSAWPF